MNAEKLKKDLSRTIELAESIHDDLAETLNGMGDSDLSDRIDQAVSDLANLMLCLVIVREEVSA